MQIKADQAVEREIQVVHAVVRARDFAVEREEQRDSVLRHRVGRIGRHASDGKAKLLRRVDVHRIESRATQRDVFHA